MYIIMIIYCCSFPLDTKDTKHLGSWNFLVQNPNLFHPQIISFMNGRGKKIAEFHLPILNGNFSK